MRAIQWSKEELADLRRRYVGRFEPGGEGESVVVSIAKEKGCSIYAVYAQLSKLGVTITRERPEAHRRLIVEEYVKDGSSQRVGDKFGYPPNTVIRWARKAGIDTRGGFPWTREDDKLLRREAHRKTASQLMALIGRGVTIDMVRNRLKLLRLKSPANHEKRKYVLHELPRKLAKEETRIYVMVGRNRTAYVGQTRTRLRVRIKNNLNSFHGRAKRSWARREQRAGSLQTIEVLHVPSRIADSVEHSLANALANEGYRLRNVHREPKVSHKKLVARALRVLANPHRGRYSPLPTSATIYLVEHHNEPRYVGRTVRLLSDRLDSHFAAARQGEQSRFCQWLRSLPSREGVTIRALETAKVSQARRREIVWITTYKALHGASLLNENL